MSWFTYAVIGHLLNGFAFIVDKVLLQTAFKRASTYAAALSLLTVIVLFAFPFIDTNGGTWVTWIASLGYGACFVLALVAFFEALKAGESTSVVPLIGTGIPIMTLIGSIVATQEKPSTYGYLGFSILIISAFLLTWKKKTQKTDKRALYTSLVAILLFSISNVLGKVAFQVWPFLSVFVVSRIACFIVAIILLWLDTQARAELKQFIGGKTKSSSKITGWTRLLLLLGQIGGAVGFLLVNIGLSKGNAGLVTALQATQYALIAMVGWFGGARMTKLLSEEISTEAKLKKGLAFIGIAIGLWFTTR